MSFDFLRLDLEVTTCRIVSRPKSGVINADV
jgi:hypothetical protein